MRRPALPAAERQPNLRRPPQKPPPPVRPLSAESDRTLTISFDRTAHVEFLKHLDDYVHDAKEILDAWDVYSDEHTDLDGWPHDDHAYGLRQSQRDADTAAAFESVHGGARYLLATADTQLGRIPTKSVQNRWAYQLGVLSSALDRLDTLHEEWRHTRDSLPVDTQPGTPIFDDALADHHAECWSYLDDWATHGHAVRDINSAARHTSSPLASPPTVTAAPAAGRSVSVRR